VDYEKYEALNSEGRVVLDILDALYDPVGK